MELAGQRVVVMGLGRFGGGVGVARFLHSRGARLLVTDLEPPDKLRDSVARLADLPGIDYRLGEHREDDFASADLVVVNPAVDVRNNRFVRAARDAGVALTSEIRLLIAHLPAPRTRTLGITGTAGKSTTTAMIGHILRAVLGERTVHVGGNIGGSLLGSLDRIGPEDWVVLELSSFMLDDMAPDRWSPHIAVVTNIADNHLDRHGTMEAYIAAKQVILDHQGPADHAIMGPNLMDVFSAYAGQVTWMDADTDPLGDIPLLLPGRHNQLNAAMAVKAVGCAGVSTAQAVAALADFPGLPHRLQFVAEHGGAGGVRYYNDSKATTPEAAMLALGSFPPGVVHAILGGYDKHSDLTALARFAARHCRAVYTIGVTGPAVAQACHEAPDRVAEVVPSQTLDAAMSQIVTRVRRGDVVLLSPACASWDQFENYEKRGAAFAEAVLRCTGEGAPLPRPAPDPASVPGVEPA